MATKEQTCTTKSTVYHNLWEIHQFEPGLNKQWTSEVFFGYSSYSGGCEASWHYVLEVLRSREMSYSRAEYIFNLTTVIDSCLTSSKAVVELEHRNKAAFKASGKTETGSKLGQLSFTSDDIDIDNKKAKFSLKFSLVEDPVPQEDSLLEENFTNLLSNEELSDVTILVGPEKFYAQRAILSVRSPVFAAMFQSDMQEAKLNRIVIEDIAPEVFEQVLRFIYIDRVEGLDRMAHELLAAADKYALVKLRKICERFLLANITRKETVLKTLVLADLYHESELKDCAIQFICKNIKLLKATDWKSFIGAHPDLVAEVLAQMTID